MHVQRLRGGFLVHRVALGVGVGVHALVSCVSPRDCWLALVGVLKQDNCLAGVGDRCRHTCDSVALPLSLGLSLAVVGVVAGSCFDVIL